MQNGNQTKNNHFVPRFYLKQWADKQKQLVYYTLERNKVVTTSTSVGEAGRQLFLYPQQFENYLQQIEVRTAPIYKKIISTKYINLSEDEKIVWCRFLVSLLYRSEVVVTVGQESAKKIVEKDKTIFELFNIDTQKLENTWSYKAITSFTEADGRFEEYKDNLLQLTWHIENAEDTGCTFITSNYPVIGLPIHRLLNAKISELDSKQYEHITSIKDMFDLYILSLPLTPNLCFYAYKDSKICMRDRINIEIQNNNMIERIQYYIVKYGNDYNNSKSKKFYLYTNTTQHTEIIKTKLKCIN